MLWILPAIFVLVQSPSGDSVRAYEGHSQEAILSLLQSEGKTGEFITQQQYEAAIAASTPPILTPTEILVAERSSATQELNVGTFPATKLQRAVLLVALDEINLLRQRDRDRSIDVAAATSLADLKTRWAARPSLADRTITQFKNAVQTKINSGASD